MDKSRSWLGSGQTDADSLFVSVRFWPKADTRGTSADHPAPSDRFRPKADIDPPNGIRPVRLSRRRIALLATPY